MADVVKGTEEEKRAEADLTAQTNMAQWAKWMFWATIATFAATGTGVAFLWQDIRQNRSIGEAQVRAYLVPQNGTFWISEHGIYAEVGFFNVGQSPAFALQSRNKMVSFGGYEQIRQQNGYDRGGRDVVTGEVASQDVSHYAELSSLDMASLAGSETILWHVRYLWFDVFQNCTEMTVGFSATINRDIQFIGREGVITAGSGTFVSQRKFRSDQIPPAR